MGNLQGAVMKWAVIGLSAASFSFATRVIFSRWQVAGVSDFFLGQ